ncbi:MAG: hypothetical protein ABJA80_05720 [bacterium]
MNRKKTVSQTKAPVAHEARDWRPLFARLTEALDWALDVTHALADGDQDDIDAIERVREFLHSWLHGELDEFDIGDVYTALAVLFAAIELDDDIEESPVIAAMRRPAMHFPGAARNQHGTTPGASVSIRRPRHRNSRDGFTFLTC